MIATEAEIDRIARDLIARHGSRAARVAAEQVNDMIDRGNAGGREVWACVVHAIHERQGSGPVWSRPVERPASAPSPGRPRRLATPLQ